MAYNLRNRHFLKLLDFTPEEIRFLLNLSADLKKAKYGGYEQPRLKGKNIALIFEKASTRTRCAFEVAAFDQGAQVTYLGPSGSQIGYKETMKDTARVLGRMYDGIEYRGFGQEIVEELAKYAGVPVWNGLTDTFHPTQVLADYLTVIEAFGSLDGITIAYVGDGRNNMANSLMVIASKLGVDFRIVTPKSLQPNPTIHQRCMGFAAESGAKLTVTDHVDEGVKGAHVLYTDVWASMGEEDQIPERIALLKPYQINEQMFQKTGVADAIFLHCLPAFHNHETVLAQQFPEICEVTDEVFEGPRSRVFDEAENRMHTIKAVMVATLNPPSH